MTTEFSPELPDDVAETTASTLAAIGERIREVRQARNMTLQVLAESTKLSVSMLSLVERGRASPSIGSLIVIASALGVTMSDLIASEPDSDEELVVRASQHHVVETPMHVVRRVIREDRTRVLTVEVDKTAHILKSGDLISYNSRRPHKIWNNGRRKVRTLWFNLDRES